MTLSSQFLRLDDKDITVPCPHDLLKGEGKISSLLPDILFQQARTMYRRYSYRIGRKTSPFTLYQSEGVAFIHIPKNAGTFINSVVYPNLPPEVSTEINAHHSVQYLNKLNSRTFTSIGKFAILRHPRERLRSAFDYLKFKTPFDTDKIFAETFLARFPDFQTLCTTISTEEFKTLLHWPHFQPQISFICDARGKLLIDALTTFEGMDLGLPRIGAHWGKEWSIKSKAMSTSLENSGANRFVKTHYADDLRLWERVHSAPAHQTLVA